MPRELWAATTSDGGTSLSLVEAEEQEWEAVAAELSAFYNDPHNLQMMANSAVMTAAEVLDYYREARASGARLFLLYRGTELLGDADLRHIEDGRAECAIMIGNRAEQGRGLGTRFALMLHALAFGPLALERIYVAIIAENKGSQRLFAKLGYEPDTSLEARAYAEDPSELVLRLDKARLESLFTETLTTIALHPRTPLFWPYLPA